MIENKKSLVLNAADPEQVKEGGRKEKDARKRELEDVRVLLALVEGRRFLWRYLSVCNIYANSFTGGNETFFNEGKRYIGTTLLQDLTEADPEAYPKMILENARKEQMNG